MIFVFLNVFWNLFFEQLIRISTNGLGIKSGYKYDFVNMSNVKTCKLLVKNLNGLKEFKSRLPLYKNILSITLYKIGNLK